MELKCFGTTSGNTFPAKLIMESAGKSDPSDKHPLSVPDEPVVGEELVSKRVQMFENLKNSSTIVLNEKKNCLPSNVNVYNDLIASLIAVLVPNANFKCAHRLKKTCDSFDQSELEYLVRCLSAVPQDSRWPLVPSLVKNIKNQFYKDVSESYPRRSSIVVGEPRNDLPTNFKSLVEKNFRQFSGIDVPADENLNDVVAAVLLLAGVLRKNDEWAGESAPNSSGGGESFNNDIEEIKIRGNASDNAKNDYDDDVYEDLIDFHIEKKPFSQTMFNLMTKDLKRRKNKKNLNNKTEIFSIDSALDVLISEIDSCTERSSEITDRMKTLSIENPDVVYDKISELEVKLENVKLKIDEYIANVLNCELKCRIEAARVDSLASADAGSNTAEMKTDANPGSVAEDDSGKIIGNDPVVKTNSGINSVEMKTSWGPSLETGVAVVDSVVSTNYGSSPVDSKINRGTEDKTVVDTAVSKDNDSSTVDREISHGTEGETVVDSIVSKDEDSSTVDSKITHGTEDKRVVDSVVSKDGDSSITIYNKISQETEDKTVVDSIVSKDKDSSTVDSNISHETEDRTVVDSVVSKDNNSSTVDSEISKGTEGETVVDSVVSKENNSSTVNSKNSHRTEDEKVVNSILPKDYDSSPVGSKISHGTEDETLADSIDDGSGVDTKSGHGCHGFEDEIIISKSFAETEKGDGSAPGTNASNSFSSESEVSVDVVEPSVEKASGSRCALIPGSGVVSRSKEVVTLDKSKKRIDVTKLNRKYSLINRLVALPIENLAKCIPCDTSFEVYENTLKIHTKSAEHLLNLQNYNTKAQREILKSNREFLNTLGISEQLLWSERVFVDPEKKIIHCGVCGAELSYNNMAVNQHIRGKRHATNKPKKSATASVANPSETPSNKFIQINRILYESSKPKCVPCGARLKPDPAAIASHVKSDEHCRKLDEHNLVLQKEIVKSNPDLFGEGKRYPLSEKHFREDRLFLNPVSDFAYCGVCRKEIVFQDVNDILSHVSSESHVSGLIKLGQNNAQSNVGGSVVDRAVVGVESNDSRDAGEDSTIERTGNNPWYVSLTKWVANSGTEIPIAKTHGTTDEEVNSQSAKILADIVQMKDTGKEILKCRDFENDANNLKPKFTTKREPAKKRVNIDKKMAKLQRLVQSSVSNRIGCVPCGVTIESDLNAVQEHVASEDHKRNLCLYNCKAQREIIKKNPQIFGQNKMFNMTDANIERDMIFVQPDGKFIFCGLCAKELTYSLKNVNAHVEVPAHVKKRMNFLKSPNEKKQTLEYVNDVKSGKNVEDNILLTGNTIFAAELIEKKDVKTVLNKVHLDTNKTVDKLDLNNDKEGFQEDSALFIPCTRVVDDKIVCLLCDVRNIPSQKCLQIHLKSPTHQANLKLFNEPQNMTPNEQEYLMKNMIALLYGRNPLVFKCFACQSACFFDVKTAISHIKASKHIKTLARVMRQETEKQRLDATTSQGKENGGSVDKQMAETEEVQNINEESFDAEERQNRNSFNMYREYIKGDRVEKINTESKLTPPRHFPVGNAYAVDNKKVKVVDFDHAKKFIRKTERGYMCAECNLQILSIPMAYAHLRSCGHSPVIVDGVQFLKEANYQCLVCNVKICGIKCVVDHISEKKTLEKFCR